MNDEPVKIHFDDLTKEQKGRFYELVNNHGLAGYYKFLYEIDEEFQKRLDRVCEKPNPWFLLAIKKYE